jgi:hypothetical protein
VSESPEALAEKVRAGITGHGYPSMVAGIAALDALLALLDAKETAAHGWAQECRRAEARLAEAERRVRELEADPSRPTVVYAGDELEACEEKLAAAEEQLRAVGG